MFFGDNYYIKAIFFYNVPEFFAYGSELGELLFSISIGYIVTYWFYYLTTYRPAQEKKKRAEAHVNVYVKKVNQSYSQMKEKMISINSDILKTLKIKSGTKRELKICLKLTNPRASSTIRNRDFNQMNWGLYFKYNGKNINRNLRESIILIGNLDPNQIEVISELLSQPYLQLLENINLDSVQSLDFLLEPMWGFEVLVEELKIQFPDYKK